MTHSDWLLRTKPQTSVNATDLGINHAKQPKTTERRLKSGVFIECAAASGAGYAHHLTTVSCNYRCTLPHCGAPGRRR